MPIVFHFTSSFIDHLCDLLSANENLLSILTRGAFSTVINQQISRSEEGMALTTCDDMTDRSVADWRSSGRCRRFDDRFDELI